MTGLYLHDHFPQLAESFSAMYIRNISRQSGLDLLSHFQQRYSERFKASITLPKAVLIESSSL